MLLSVAEAAGYGEYEVWERKNETERQNETLTRSSDEDNAFSRKVIGIGIASTGALITLLGLIAPTGRLLVIGIGLLLILFGLKIRRHKAVNKK